MATKRNRTRHGGKPSDDSTTLTLGFEVPEAKRCRHCRRVLPLTAFRVHDQRKRLRNLCWDCMRTRKYPAERAHRLRTQYGITPQLYARMFAQHGGVCAICQTVETSKSKHGVVYHLTVDHDHTTGKVRGLLCQKCNKGIGMFKDDPDLLVKAALYLTQAKGADAHGDISTLS